MSLEINHNEAFEYAASHIADSNLARCYLELHQQLDGRETEVLHLAGKVFLVEQQLEIYKTKEDELREQVKLLRDAVVMALPEIAMCETGCSAISAMKKALTATEPKP